MHQLSQHDYKLVDIRSIIEADGSNDRNRFRAGLIENCHVIFVQSIGGLGADKVIRADIYPIKIPSGFSSISASRISSVACWRI